MFGNYYELSELMSTEVEGCFLRQNAQSYVARVTVIVTPAEENSVFDSSDSEACRAKELTPAVPEDWKLGAKAGTLFALSVAGADSFHVEITRIVGTYIDTNPTIVCGAAARAVWEALSFHPSDSVVKWYEREVLTSWRHRDEIPDWSAQGRSFGVD